MHATEKRAGYNPGMEGTSHTAKKPPVGHRRWPRFSLAWALGAMSILCILLAAYQAWGLDALLLWWLVIVVASVMLLGRRGQPGWATAISILATVGLMWLVIRDARGPSSRMLECRNHLKMLALANLNYEATHRRFPYVSSRVTGSKPGLSWRVALLPFVEQDILYQKFKLDEASDGPTNRQFLESMPRWPYRCPEDRPASDQYTSYLAFAGTETVWPPDQQLGLSNIADGASNTILFSEMHDTNITWSEPRDFGADTMDWRVNGTPGSSPSSMHGPVIEYLDGSRRRVGIGRVNIAMADGSVQTLSANLDPDVLRQLANRRDGLPKPSDMPTALPVYMPD